MATSPSAATSASRRSSARSTDCTDRRARFVGAVVSFTARNPPSDWWKHTREPPSDTRWVDKTSRRESLEAQVASFPAKPGVYLFQDGKGRDLYVGKADVLPDRVRAYFGPQLRVR